MTALQYALVFALAGAAVNAIGLAVIHRFRSFGETHSVLFAAFAAGVLVAAAFVHLIPEALGGDVRAAPAFLLGGYLVMYFIGQWLGRGTQHVSHEERRAIAVAPLIAIALHSLIDGMIMAVTFRAETFTGVLSAIGLVLHEFPEGILVYVLLLRGGFATGKALAMAFAAAAMTTPLGVLIAAPLVDSLSAESLALIMAATAGALVYVGASHLLPHVDHEKRPGAMPVFLGGVALAATVSLLHRFDLLFH